MIQRADSEQGTELLENTLPESGPMPGMWHIFTPPITTRGFPIGGRDACEPTMCQFDRGYYLRPYDGIYLFYGKPINDTRHICMSSKIRTNTEAAERARCCYFFLTFNQVSTVAIAPD